MLAILQRQLSRLDQAEKAFVNECGGLEVGDAALRTQACMRDPAQVRIKDGKYAIQCAALALGGELQELRQRRVVATHLR